MKTRFRLIKALLCVPVFTSISAYSAEDVCKAWQPAAADPTGGRYSLELRICDLTMGLSAYVQIKNSSDTRIALSYRIVTNDDKHRDSDAIIEPGMATRVENCQACATRHAGFKSWQILSADIAPEGEAGTPKPAASNLGLPSFMDKQITSKSVAQEPAKPQVDLQAQKPVAVPAPVELVKPAEPSRPEEKTNAVTVPAVVPTPTPEADQEGIRAANGTVIPYDQLPPEFRPKKSN